MLTGLTHAHEGLAYLFVLSTFTSMGLALLTLALGAKPALLKVGLILARFVETSLGGLMMLLGIGMWSVMKLPVSTPYLWIGIFVIVASGGLVTRGIKPTLQQLESQDDGALRVRWVLMAIVHFALIAFAMGSMEMNLGA